jgi:O-antigen/teichoic acid export membrane protein
MTTDVLEIQTPPGLEEPAGRSEGNLTWRASLNLAQAILDYSAKLAVGLIVIPIVVGGLGRAVFGVWEMLGRLMGYLESTDGRPTQALRLVISNLQTQRDCGSKRRWIGGALAVWACFLPIWVATGALLVWYVPAITKVAEPLHGTVRVATAVLMGGVLLGGLASLPESVLRGMNLGYKRMGLQAALSVAGGLLIASAIYLELGLIGVAAASVALTALTGLCFLTLVRRQLPWFGVDRPARSEVSTLFQISLWIATGDAVAKLLLASDVIVLGMVLSPAMVTTYVLTGYAALLSVNLHSLAADAVMPGLAGIIGAREYSRAAQLRRELLGVSLLFVTAAGAAILAYNRSFVHLWVGAENYAGLWPNLLLVMIAVQTAFIRCDAYIIDATLQPGSRVRVSAVAAVVAVGLSVILTRYAGIVGLCLGILAGRAIQTIWYPVLVRGCLPGPRDSSWWLVRPFTLMGLVFGAAAYLGQQVLVTQWMAWAGAVLLTSAAAFLITLQWGLPSEIRATVRARVWELAGRVRRGRMEGRP